MRTLRAHDHSKPKDRTEEFCRKLESLIAEAIAAGVDPEWLYDAANRACFPDTKEDWE